MTEYHMQVRQLTAGYHDVPVLRDVTIEIPRGGIVTLIGPNGAGKSTLLRSIAGQLAPTAGCVLLGQEDLYGMSRQELARRMASVFTDKVRTELMTCEDVVAGGRYRTFRHPVGAGSAHRVRLYGNNTCSRYWAERL